MFNTFYNKISSIIDKHIPDKQLSKKECRFLSKPWITMGLRKSIYTKNNMYKKFLKSKSIYTHAKFKLYRNKLNHLLKISKRKYYNNYFLKTLVIVKKYGKELNKLFISNPRLVQNKLN